MPEQKGHKMHGGAGCTSDHRNEHHGMPERVDGPADWTVHDRVGGWGIVNMVCRKVLCKPSLQSDTFTWCRQEDDDRRVHLGVRAKGQVVYGGGQVHKRLQRRDRGWQHWVPALQVKKRMTA